jgi:hypothetical protein
MERNKSHVVRPEYRTNPLSTRPGGFTVTALLRDGRQLVYENIKNPDAYIRKATEDPAIVSFLVDGKPYQKTRN